MSATCPACGVPVVPGYVKCPKCHAGLPGQRAHTKAAGGTVAADRSFPIAAVAVPGAIILVLILVIAFRGGGDTDKPEATGSAPMETTPTQPGQPQPTPSVVTNEPEARPVPTGPDPRAAIAELDRTLRRQRFWSTIEHSGANVDVRSSSCEDIGMRQTIDGAASSLRQAGLTRLRCLAQSGAVVFERDL